MDNERKNIPKKDVSKKDHYEKRSIPFGKEEHVYKNAVKYDTSKSPNEEFFKKKN